MSYSRNQRSQHQTYTRRERSGMARTRRTKRLRPRTPSRVKRRKRTRRRGSGHQHPELIGLEVGVLPWTDRMFCETLPLVDEGLEAPWSTVEFDSAFLMRNIPHEWQSVPDLHAQAC